jgi:predicted GNAT family acetyltransferase
MPAETTADPDVINDVDEQLYELRIGGEVAGVASYEVAPGRIVFLHTAVEPAFEGQGVGGRLAKAALDDARSRHLRVIARCPFIAEYIRRHPDYQDLVESHD